MKCGSRRTPKRIVFFHFKLRFKLINRFLSDVLSPSSVASFLDYTPGPRGELEGEINHCPFLPLSMNPIPLKKVVGSMMMIEKKTAYSQPDMIFVLVCVHFPSSA